MSSKNFENSCTTLFSLMKFSSVFYFVTFMATIDRLKNVWLLIKTSLLYYKIRLILKNV